jgi:TetR/AcrR family tetracycline transcriptional repressor
MASAGGAKSRERLSPEVIVRGAFAVADREGLEAVTIRRLAADNGVSNMALYWHFRDKEQLLAGMAEYLLAQIELPAEEASEPWDRRLYAALSALLGALRPHPTTAGLTSTRMLSSEAGLRVTEYILGLLDEADFTVQQRAVTATHLLSSIIALVTGHPGTAHTGDPEVEEARARTTTAHLAALDPAHFPQLVASAAALTRCTDDESYYASGLELLVYGVRAMAEHLAASANAASPANP